MWLKEENYHIFVAEINKKIENQFTNDVKQLQVCTTPGAPNTDIVFMIEIDHE